jgi:hypothetical protein
VFTVLNDDSTTTSLRPESVERMIHLSLYQPVIYCDDSSSMANNNRYLNQCELVTRIAGIITKFSPDGHDEVALHFINDEYSSNVSADRIDAVMRRVIPNGGTKIGTGLRHKILEPMVYNVLSRGQRLQRPILVWIITNGIPGSESESTSTFKDAIMECKKRLVGSGYNPNTVTFCVGRIGGDKAVVHFLDGLRGDTQISDVLQCTTDQLDSKYEELKDDEESLDEWLLELLLKPIQK